MSSGSHQILEYCLETAIGTTPTPFARQTLPFTENSLDSAVTKEDSNTIIGNRLASKGMITGVDYAGDINAEAKFGDYDQLIEAAAFNKFEIGVPTVGSDKLTFGGSIRQTFSILRGYEDIANYHIFSGVHVNTFNLDIPEQGIVTFGFGLMGKKRVVANGAAPAGTVVNASNNPSLSNVSVGQILWMVYLKQVRRAFQRLVLHGITQCKFSVAWVLVLRLAQSLKRSQMVQVHLLPHGLLDLLRTMKSNSPIPLFHLLFHLPIQRAMSTN